jgi:hypothetical protein
MVNTHIIIRKYRVYLSDFVCFFAMSEYMRGAAWYRPLNLSFWVVRSEPPFVLVDRAEVNQNAAYPWHLTSIPFFIPLNQLFGAILDFGLRIADLLYRFALSFLLN